MQTSSPASTDAKLTTHERFALLIIAGREAWKTAEMSEALASVIRSGLVEVGQSYSESTLRLSEEGRAALGLGKR